MIIAIIGVLASIAIPAFSVWLPGYSLRSAATDLYSNLQLAKMQAVRNNRDYAVVFDIANDTYRLVDTVDGDYDYPGGDDEVEKTVVLADYGGGVAYGRGNAGSAFNVDRGFGNGVTFEDTVVGVDIVVFNSQGMIDQQVDSGGEVYVSNSKNASYTVGALMSGVFYLRRWNGGAWRQN